MPTAMTWWTVPVVVVVMCAEAVRAEAQETGPHSVPTAADRGYAAEWQWEQWPQQMISDIVNMTRGPGARIRSSLWFDSSANSWWLFGGRQVPSNSGRNNTKPKDYTDLWRYDTNARGWSRIFPNDKLKRNDGAIILLRTNLLNDGHNWKASETSNSNSGVVLCGRSEGKRLDERSLAVYGPRSSHSNTVWQLELKDKQWTTYVCCCDNTGQNARNNSSMPTGTVRHESNVTRNFSIVHGNIQVSDYGCNDTTLNQNLKEEISIYFNTDNTENSTNKSEDDEIQNRTLEGSTKQDNRKTNILFNNFELHEKVDSVKKESNESIPTHSSMVENFGKDNKSLFGGYNDSQSTGKLNNTDFPVQYGHKTLETSKNCQSDMENIKVDVSMKNISSNTNYSDLTEEQTEGTIVQNLANTTAHGKQQRDIKLNKDVTTEDTYSNQAFCPDFEVSDNSNERSRGQPVAWCDTNKELLVALDLKVIPLTLWQFDLKTSHWAQQKVYIEEGTLWPGCSSHIRYTSTGSTVYILCPPYGATDATSTRLVYTIDASNATLKASGQLQLNFLFGNQNGNAIWADEAKTILQAVDADNRTLLLIAYDKFLDMWVLDRNCDHCSFVQVENIWRGSALKWFRGFEALFYNLQVGGQTWLLPNPRQVTQYWPHERGRFIIRLIDHGENSSGVSPIKEQLHTMEMKNHSETNIPVLQHHQAQDGIKALVFFAFSLSIFAIFGMAIFVRRCVTCPPQSWPLRGDDGSKTVPHVIRYSVIPDDLAYPVA